MQYDRFDVDVRDVDWVGTDEEPTKPALHITVHSERQDFEDELTGRDGEFLSADEVDVGFRYQTATEDADATGVFSVADRATGAFILESTTPAEPIQTFIEAADRYAENTNNDHGYGLCFETDRRLITTYEKRVFLVYARDGTLLRHRSLIPNGIEI